jgi:tRNA-intron endonuclease
MENKWNYLMILILKTFLKSTLNLLPMAKKQEREVPEEVKEKVKVIFIQGKITTENSDLARDFFNKSRYGTLLEDGSVQLSLLETLYLLEKEKIELYDGRNKKLDFCTFFKKSSKQEPNVWIRYSVFKDIRNRGYIIKTALKFGADFRVYDRGVKPGEDHAKWIVYPVHEGSSITWYEFAAKNRVAHSTKKRLMMGVVDDEGDVSYWEIRWIRP